MYEGGNEGNGRVRRGCKICTEIKLSDFIAQKPHSIA